MHPRQRRRLDYPPELSVILDFPKWLKDVVQARGLNFEEDILELSLPPNFRTKSFKSLKAYEKLYRVCSAETKSVIVDSGVTVTCETMQRSSVGDANLVCGEVTYFGQVKEILELDYGRLKLILLLCDWVRPISRGPTACIRRKIMDSC